MKKQVKTVLLEQLSSQLSDNLNIDLPIDLVDEVEKEHYNVIKGIVVNEISPNSEVNKKVNVVQNSLRKVGQRFFNLFKVTFTVEFAGVTLIHFTIPKVDEDGNIINSKKK